MYLAKVIGHVEARIRLPGFAARRLLLLQPLDFRQQPIRWTVIACDASNTSGGGAGVGSLVTYVEGREAANPFDPPIPVDACVTAVVDDIDFAPTPAG